MDSSVIPAQAGIQSINIDSLLRGNDTIEQLTVTGNSNLYNVSIANSLLVGTTLIDQNSIISLASELRLSALAKINLFDGAVIIAKDGTITTRGELIAEKGIRTNEIKGLSDNNQVSINNLSTNNIAISDKYLDATDSASIIAAPDNFEKNGLFALAIETTTSSAGIGILPENNNNNPNEVVVYNDNIKKDSLVYITPTSDYPSSNQLTVVKKEYIGAKPYFKVVSAVPSTTPIKFNWLIIKLISVLLEYIYEKSFTLMEIMIVVTLIVIVATALLVGLKPLTQIYKGQDSRRKSELAALQKVLEDFYNDKQCYPKPNEVCYNDTGGTTCNICGRHALSPQFSPIFPISLAIPDRPKKTIPIRLMTQRLPAPLIIEFIQLFPINLIQSLPKNANMVADRPLILAITTALAAPTLV